MREATGLQCFILSVDSFSLQQRHVSGSCLYCLSRPVYSLLSKVVYWVFSSLFEKNDNLHKFRDQLILYENESVAVRKFLQKAGFPTIFRDCNNA